MCVCIRTEYSNIITRGSRGGGAASNERGNRTSDRAASLEGVTHARGTREPARGGVRVCLTSRGDVKARRRRRRWLPVAAAAAEMEETEAARRQTRATGTAAASVRHPPSTVDRLARTSCKRFRILRTCL